MSGKGAKKPKDDTSVKITVEHLTAVLGLVKKPSVAGDPVVKALIQGLIKSNDDFKTASLVVSTLRNAGCMSIDNQKSGETKEKADKKAKNGKETPKKETSPIATGKKLRGLNRSIDYLIATNKVDSNSPAIQSIRNLRADGDKEIKIQKVDKSIVSRKISAIDDYDLLYLMDRPNYDLLMSVVSLDNPQMGEGGFYEKQFSFWNQDSNAKEFVGAISEKISDGKEKLIFQEGALNGYSPLARILKGSVINRIIQVLKDTTIPSGVAVPDGDNEIQLYQTIVDTLQRENWFKFGKSPSTVSMVV
jgi:hypothetical protein